MLSFLSRVGLHIWSVTWPLASRGTHPVVGFNSNFIQKSFHLIQISFRWEWPRQAVHSPNQAIAGFKTVLILWHHLWSGWWVATLPRGAGAWRRWRCIMTQGNIDMECPTQGYQLFLIILWNIYEAWILCSRLQWPCVNVKHVSGTWMRSWGCQKPSTCFLTWTGALLPFRWIYSSVRSFIVSERFW